MNSTNQRIEHIAVYAKKHLETSYKKRLDKARLNRFLSGWEYRWSHTLRVAQYGRMIAESEGADLDLIIPACLLHDIAWFNVNEKNDREHGIIGAEMVRPYLKTLAYTFDQINNICYSIASHVSKENPETLEARVVSDADNVDRYGPYRILQWCFSGIDDYESLTNKLSDRIKRLEHYREDNPLFTEVGKQLFAEQLHLQILFFSEFVGEKKITCIPQI